MVFRHNKIKQRQTLRIALPTGRTAEFCTFLDDSSIRMLPQDLACHGTKASEMIFFEIGDGIFSGHGVFIKPGYLTLQNLFSNSIDALGVCIRQAAGFSCKAFAANAYEKVDVDDYPLILIAKNQYQPYFSAAREDIVAAILPSEEEMNSIIRKARSAVLNEPQWRLALEFDFLNNVASILVQKIIAALEKLVC